MFYVVGANRHPRFPMKEAPPMNRTLPKTASLLLLVCSLAACQTNPPLQNATGVSSMDVDPGRKGPVSGVGVESQDILAMTDQMMRDMVDAGEVDALVAERVWQELARGLMEGKPSRMFEVLRECGALARLLPEVQRLWGVPQRADYHPEVDTGVHLMMVLDMCARLDAPLSVRFACLTHDLGKGTTPQDILPRHHGHEERSAQLLKDVCERLRVPTECRELADVVAREHGNIHRSAELNAAAVVRLLERCDAFRKPRRFGDVLLACECDARGRGGLQEQPYPQRDRLSQALAAAQSIDTAAVAAQAMEEGVSGPVVGERIHRARIEAVAASLAD